MVSKQLKNLKIAIAAPNFGVISETFITQHVKALEPKNSVLICADIEPEFKSNIPILSSVGSYRVPNSILQRVVNNFSRRYELVGEVKLSNVASKRLKHFLIEQNIDVVLVEYLDYAARLSRSIYETGIPFVAHAHGYDISRLPNQIGWNRQYRKLFARASGIVACTNFVANKARTIGCSNDILHINPYGIDVSNFPISQRNSEKLLSVGRFVEKKAPHKTLEAFSLAQKSFPNIHLDMIGDGPLFSHCRALVHKLGIQGSVSFHGALPSPEVQKYLSKASIFLQHSVTAKDGDTEGFGVSLVEAMASGIPVVSTIHNGFVETVVDGETGILVEEHDVSAMSNAIVKLLRFPDQANCMSIAARQRAIRCYDSRDSAIKLKKILHSAATNGSKH